jgi:hypothetical protein
MVMEPIQQEVQNMVDLSVKRKIKFEKENTEYRLTME